jgi:phospholipid/cholesterol/gamma-HCH transport system substrate-binding protein
MVLFALSCVGLLLFLWLSFGGTIPLNPQGYRVRISFPYAQQVADDADVRIAGVTVGKVVDKSLDPHRNRTIVTIELQRQFSPIHRDARAILRQKTILGETYVALTPGSPGAPILRDGALLPRGQVKTAVQLDQIFNAFDPPTRRAFQVWQQQLATGIRNNDQNFNYVLGNLPTFAADATDVLQVLYIEHQAVVGLFHNGGTVFAALSQNTAALRNVITSGETTFHTTALNANALADTFHVFPTFLDETKLTLAQLRTFSLNADPLAKELVPVAQNLTPTLRSLDQLSPYLRRFFTALGPLIDASRTGLPATAAVLEGARPLLGQLGPFLEQLNPILSWLSLHQQLVSDFISNGAGGLAARTDSFGGNGVGHYLRQFGPSGPETLSFDANRDANNRGNTYPAPLWLGDPANFTANGQGNTSFIFPAWDCRNTGAAGEGDKPADTASGTGSPACWTQPPLPGAPGKYKIAALTAAKYSKK